MVNSTFDPELAHTLADHLMHHARSLLEAGDDAGAEAVFLEAAHIQVHALQHVLGVAKPERTAILNPKLA